MTDRELLELAAKAAGIGLVGPTDKYIAQHDKGSAAFIIDNDKGGHSNWNPITDDGDALRLAVKLGMIVHIDHDHCFCVEVNTTNAELFEPLSDAIDPYAATRRAITRAAAEIGKAIP